MNKLFRWLASAMALGIPAATLAQPTASDPGKPGLAAPPLLYRSAFADYKPWQDTKPGDWKAMNDAVGKSGGHSMSMSMGGASAPAPAAPKPAMSDHSGHQMPMKGGNE